MIVPGLLVVGDLFGFVCLGALLGIAFLLLSRCFLRSPLCLTGLLALFSGLGSARTAGFVWGVEGWVIVVGGWVVVFVVAVVICGKKRRYIRFFLEIILGCHGNEI